MSFILYKMEIRPFYFNELRECCYIAWDESKECVIIDPGFGSDNEFDRLKKFVSDNGLEPRKILLTHGHFDHTLGLESAAKYWNIPVYMSLKDVPQLRQHEKYVEMLGLKSNPFTGTPIDVSDGQIISFGSTQIEVLETPGHTPGCVCYLCRESGVLFSGDTLFAGSIGRTDLDGGDYGQIMTSISRKLMVLDSDVRVLPGHGPSTSIGYERSTNPFLETL